MIHNMRLQALPFELIENGYKTIELRLYDDKRKSIAVGDTIIFSHTDIPEKTLEVFVKAVHIFENFGQLYARLPLEKIGYMPGEIFDAKPSDMEQYYSEEEQRQYGVVGIEIQRV